MENKYGVKVGDIFTASWGYDETHASFFQVLALAGAESVRVREVYPPIIGERCGNMSADRVYKTKGVGILPPSSYSLFIKNQKDGDLKRLKMYGNLPHFKMANYANAYLCGEQTTAFESWWR